MSDYIKREDAIETIYKLREHFKCWDTDDDIAIKNTLNAIPPADVRENVRGEWIFPYGDKKYKRCSVCGSVFYSIPYNTNFCPSCGADMRG